MAMAKAVAKVFEYLSQKVDGTAVGKTRLNKLLYYAQGHSLGETGEPLFSNNVDAWNYGPVVAVVYTNYDKIIQEADRDGISGTGLTPAQLELIVDVWNQYGREPAHSLVERTHRSDTPWSRCYNGQRNAHISQEIMKEYFSRSDNRLKRSTREAIQRIPEIDKLPKEDYDPEEDAIWEAMLREN